MLDTIPISRVNSVELLKKPETPGRGVSRRGSLFRCNSIIDGNELDVSVAAGAAAAAMFSAWDPPFLLLLASLVL